MFHSCSLLAEKSNSFALPLGLDCSEQQNAKWNPCFFQTKRDKIVGFDILKGFKAANSLVQLVVRGCGR